MTTSSHDEEYDQDMVAALALVWGEGFMAPGGSELVHKTLAGLQVAGKRILDIGCGTGGGALVMARELQASVVAIDLEEPLVARARGRVIEAGLEGQITVSQCSPGPLPFCDGDFDIVYSVGAFTQTEDKLAIFKEAWRVLKSSGSLVSYDWTKRDPTLSEAMKHWVKLEELTYEMITIESQCDLLRAAGFVNVRGADDQGWYARESQQEYHRLNGPLRSQLVQQIGEQKAQHTLDDWEAMITVLKSGELCPAFFHALKP